MQIGVDFGTTNSIISYWDESAQAPKEFLYGGQSEYTPTAVVYDETDLMDIGHVAIELWSGNQDLQLARFFKTLLTLAQQPDQPPNVPQKDWPLAQTPYQVTRDYLEQILLKNEDGFVPNRGDIEGLVVSVPELWQANFVNSGGENLENIFKELNLPLRQLLSEPIAAVAYYVWKEVSEDDQEKNVLVCDFGGGTIDISLCVVKKPGIKVLDFEGNENRAGVKHLQLILERIYAQNGITTDQQAERQSRDLLELDKLLQSKGYAKKLETIYAKDMRLSKPVFKINNELEVFAHDIFAAFEDIKTGIITVLDNIKKRSGTIDFDTVLFVGGFSQYFLTRQTILNYFDLEADSLKVKTFESRKDRLYAISFGATLVAANQVQIKERYPHSIYFNALKIVNHELQKIAKPMIEAGADFLPNHPQFSKAKIYNHTVPLEGYVMLEGTKRVDFKKEIALPADFIDGTQFEVGIEINHSNLVKFVVRNGQQQMHKVDLSELFDD